MTGRYSIVDLSGRAIASGVSDGTLIEQDALSGIYIVVTEKGNKKVIGKPEWSQRLLRFLYLKIKREGNDASMMQWCVIICYNLIKQPS